VQRRLPSDPLPDIRDEQESLVIRHLADGLEESDFDVLDRLVTDGGQLAPNDIADAEGWHLNTIYRALDRLGELVDRRYGEVHLASHAVAEQVAEKVRWAREVATEAAESAASALERIDDLGSGADRVEGWLDQHGARLDEVGDDDQLVIDIGPFDGDRDDLQVALSELRYRWGRAGLERGRLLQARVRFALSVDDSFRTVPPRSPTLLGLRRPY